MSDFLPCVKFRGIRKCKSLNLRTPVCSESSIAKSKMESSFIAHRTGRKLAHTEFVVLCMLKRAINCSTTYLWVFDCAISKILGFYTLLVSPLSSGHNEIYTVCDPGNPFLKINRRQISATTKATTIRMNSH